MILKSGKKNFAISVDWLLDEIEADLLEPDTTALFDARNNVKTELIEGVAL
jgi:hypothetical protein